MNPREVSVPFCISADDASRARSRFRELAALGTTPDHTAVAYEVLGQSAWPEHREVLSRYLFDTEMYRAIPEPAPRQHRLVAWLLQGYNWIYAFVAIGLVLGVTIGLIIDALMK